MGETFYKLSGAGNDFIALIEPEQDPPEEEIRAICARALSLGADGFLVLKRLPEGGIDLGYWNSDGGRCDFCLNGSRCAVQLAASAGLVDPNEFFRLKTDAGLLQGRCRGEHEAELRLPEGFAGEPRTRFLEVGGQSYAGFQVLVGVPHFVLPWEQNLATVPIAELGARLRHHQDLGPGGAFTHQRRVSPIAQRQLQRVDEDRLAGASLPRQHGKARLEVQLELTDDDDIAKRKTTQHLSARRSRP